MERELFEVNELSDIGYLEKEKKSKNSLYEIGDLFNEFEFTVDWKKVIEESKKNIKEEFPEIADKYIEKYCTYPINVVHPFSGKLIDISKLEIQKLDLTETRNDLAAFIQSDEDKQKAKEKKAKKKEEESIDIVEEQEIEEIVIK
jgi:UDP-2,3-diacylglucosamine pyrophosphatase LpxH